MRIIDAHAHIFEHLHGFGSKGELRAVGGGKARWANGDSMQVIPPQLGDRSFTAEALFAVMDRYGVEKAVLLQGSLYGFANDYAAEMIGKYPDRLGGAGSYDPFCLDSEKILTRLTSTLGYHIIKLEFSSRGGFMGYHEDFKINSPMMEMLWQRAADLNLVIVLDIGSPGDKSYQITELESVVRRYPHTTFVIAHLGAPTLSGKVIFEEMLELLAPCKNVNFDLSAMLWNTLPDASPYLCARQYLVQARQYVGADRLLWGSDTPCVLTKFDYQILVDFVVDSGVFTAGELNSLFYDNARRIYFEK